MNCLEIKDLYVEVDTKDGAKSIINGVDLKIEKDTTHVIMGPNGSGKSSLSYAIAGHPQYHIKSGSITLNGQDITELSPDKRAKAGLFLAQQLPTEIEGVTFSNFLRASYTAIKGETVGIRDWIKMLNQSLDEMNMDQSFAHRNVNVGFSGGEKKRAEILQLKILKPQYAILDETDSGLDVDALKVVAKGVNDAKSSSKFGVLMITHHTHLLEYIKPDFVYVFNEGKIVESGTGELASELVKTGYQKYQLN